MAHRVYRKTGELRWKMTQNRGSWRAKNRVEVTRWALSGYAATLGATTAGHFVPPLQTTSLCSALSGFKAPGGILE